MSQLRKECLSAQGLGLAWKQEYLKDDPRLLSLDVVTISETRIAECTSSFFWKHVWFNRHRMGWVAAFLKKDMNLTARNNLPRSKLVLDVSNSGEAHTFRAVAVYTPQKVRSDFFKNLETFLRAFCLSVPVATRKIHFKCMPRLYGNNLQKGKLGVNVS